MSPVSIFGELVNAPVGIFSPGARLAEVCLLLVVGFVAHAAFQAWQRNEPRDRQRAVVIGTAVPDLYESVATLAAVAADQP